MAVYLVTWDLNREKPNYAQARKAFTGQLEKFEHKKDSGLDSVWFISTTWTAVQVSDYLRKALDDNDRLFVTRIRGDTTERAGWLAKAIWTWMSMRY